MQDGAIIVGCTGKTVVVNVRGPGNLFNSYPLQAFFLSMLEAAADDFVMDLAECTHLDSTFMGVMAGLSQRLRKAGKGVLRVVNSSDEALRTMQRLGLTHMVQLEQATVPPLEEAITLEPADLSKLDRGRHMLHAHLELSAMSDANAKQFDQLIQTLKANVAKHQREAAPPS